jgi:arginine N-succinyltransferase
MAEFSARFEKKVISELRGVSDENGKSPFWECMRLCNEGKS